ncbi:MAG: hypothetical protein ABFC77_16000 [Thermoguttaceae bacterium]
MTTRNRRFGGRLSGWRPAVLLLTVALSGCSGWGLHDEGFRKHNDLAESAQRARTDGDAKANNVNCWGLSEKSRQIERDLAQ